jgi:hypothetical protein
MDNIARCIHLLDHSDVHCDALTQANAKDNAMSRQEYLSKVNAP